MEYPTRRGLAVHSVELGLHPNFTELDALFNQLSAAGRLKALGALATAQFEREMRDE